MSLKDMAAQAETVFEGVMKIEPMVATMASMFVPQAKPVMATVHPMVVAAAPFIEQALHNLAQGNNGDAFAAFIQLLQHLTPGQPNSPILAGPLQQLQGAMAGKAAPQPIQPQMAPNLSAQGSG